MASLGTWDDPGQPARSGAELAGELQTTWGVIRNALDRWTIADMDDVLRDVGEDGEEETFTRQWVIWHLIEHDLHHGGKVSLILGMHGLQAPDL